MGRQADKHADRQIYRQTAGQFDIRKDTGTAGYTDRHRDSCIYRQGQLIYRYKTVQEARQIKRQSDRYRERR